MKKSLWGTLKLTELLIYPHFLNTLKFHTILHLMKILIMQTKLWDSSLEYFVFSNNPVKILMFHHFGSKNINFQNQIWSQIFRTRVRVSENIFLKIYYTYFTIITDFYTVQFKIVLGTSTYLVYQTIKRC